MKMIKKIFLIITLTTIFSVSAFARSGFEFLIDFQFGLGVGVPTKTMEKENEFKSDIGFDGTALFQLGYMFEVNDNFGISFLGEFGYGMGSYSILGKTNITEISTDGIPIINSVSVSVDSYFDNIQIGLFPKLNFGNFAIGIGGGIKIPSGGEMRVTALGREETLKLNRGDIVDFFNPPIFGYVKTSFDYSFYLIDKIAFNVGLYLDYDIMKFQEETGKDEYGGTFNVGIVFGVRFGPMNN